MLLDVQVLHLNVEKLMNFQNLLNNLMITYLILAFKHIFHHNRIRFCNDL